jgi:hypothetical protein
VFRARAQNIPPNMSESERQGYVDLRARYLRLLAGLRLTRKHNPETLEALERVLPSQEIKKILPLAGPIPEKKKSQDQAQDAA